MVTGRRHFWLAGLGAAGMLVGVHAKDLSAYRVGDTAGQDISTPVALDVIDPVATAARRDEEWVKTPPIFRSYPQQTNLTLKQFIAQFSAARTSFTAVLSKSFGVITNADETVATPEFTNLAATFNQNNPALPITFRLARLWAAGDAGLKVQSRYTDRLSQALRQPIRLDALPAGTRMGFSVWLVPVDSLAAKLTLAEAEQNGKIVAESGISPLSRVCNLFRKGFPDDEQPLARAVTALIKPNCILDENLTRQSRTRAVHQLVVANHYDAGQILVHRGETLDAKTVAALAQLNEKLMPGELNSQLAAQRELARQQETLAQREHADAVRSRAREIDLHSQAIAARVGYEWLLVVLAGMAAAALVPFWWLARRRRRASMLPALIATPAPPAQVMFPDVLPPQLVASLKDAVVQGLATQRAELLQAQQAAAREISELVRRLDDLKVPMQERLKSYETRIQELEKDLAARDQENRELLRLKIEMLNEKIKAERSANRVNFN